MQKAKDMLNQMTRQGRITLAIVAVLVFLLVIAGIIFTASRFPGMGSIPFFGRDSSVRVEKGDMKTQELIDRATDAAFTKEDVQKGGYANDPQSATTYVNNTEEVQIAVVADATKYEIEGTKNISCGKLAFVTVRVPSDNLLAQSMRALFENKVTSDFTPGNIIPAYHPNLKFVSASLASGVAKIYLSGNFSGARDGVCDSNLAITQMGETAKGLPTVTAVEIYQDAQRIYSSR